MTASLYGPIITADDVETAVKTTLRAWCTTYTDEVARQKGVDLPPINYYGGTEIDLSNVNSFPALAVVCPGVVGEPLRHGDGTQDAIWAVGVGVIVAETVAYKALTLAKLYGAAVRALLVQQGSLGGFAVQTFWTDEESASEGFELDRWMASCSLQFEVKVAAVVNRFGGPTSPPANPTVPLTGPAVASTSFTLGRLA